MKRVSDEIDGWLAEWPAAWLDGNADGDRMQYILRQGSTVVQQPEPCSAVWCLLPTDGDGPADGPGPYSSPNERTAGRDSGSPIDRMS